MRRGFPHRVRRCGRVFFRLFRRFFAALYLAWPFLFDLEINAWLCLADSYESSYEALVAVLSAFSKEGATASYGYSRGPPEGGGGVPEQYDRLIEGSRTVHSRL